VTSSDASAGADAAATARVTAALEQAFPVLLEESSRLARSEWWAWPQRDAYQGEWLIYPLVSRQLAVGLGCDLEAHRRRCPGSWEVLRALPGLAEAGFSRLEPNTHIYPHAEEVASATRRVHLGLRIPEGAAIRIGGVLQSWRPGRCLTFDGHVLHEAANLGASPRTILLCDLLRDPERGAAP